MGNGSQIEKSSVLPVHARLINLINDRSKEHFKEGSCVILVSVGQLAHEGEKLKATAKIVSENYASCAVAVCDSLQRHSLQLGTNYSDEEIYTISNRLGAEWIDRNQEILESITIPCEIFRWDDWLNQSDFSECKKIIEELLMTDEEFRHSMDLTINDFVERFQKRQDNPVDEEIVRQASLNYLIEECAIIMIMWQKKNYNYIIYPSDILAVLYQAYLKLVVLHDDNLLQWVRVKLKTKKVSAKQLESVL